jgi:hypothetical protein
LADGLFRQFAFIRIILGFNCYLLYQNPNR